MNYVLKTMIVALLTLTACSTTPTNKTRRVYNPIPESMGTAFNVEYAGKTYGVTAGHVCAGSQTKFLVVTDRNKLTDIKILVNDLIFDICVLEPIPGVKPLKITASQEAPKSASTHGFPGFSASEINYVGEVVGISIRPGQVEPEDNGECPQYSLTITRGKETACLAPVLRAATTARAYRGVSGGPVIDEKGEVCGVTTAIGLPTGAPTYFAPAALLLDVLERASKLQ